jgi:ABC-2 type transport system permease protein
MRNAWAIYKKELRSYFVSPLFWVVSAVFLSLSGYYFYSDLSYFTQFGFGQNILENFYQLLFVDLRLVMLLTVPMLTMRLLAEERKLGTIELLYTYPLRDGEIFAGKYAACATVFVLMVSGTLLYPLYLYSIQPYDWIGVLGGYMGLLLLASVFIACGLFVSSLTESQAIAAVGTFFLLLIFWIMSWNEAALAPSIRDAVKALSMFDHFLMFAQGVIDTGDMFYYVVFAVFFSALTLRSMESRRWRGRR